MKFSRIMFFQSTGLHYNRTQYPLQNAFILTVHRTLCVEEVDEELGATSLGNNPPPRHLPKMFYFVKVAERAFMKKSKLYRHTQNASDSANVI